LTSTAGYINATGLNKGTYTINVTRVFYYSKQMSTTIDSDGDVDTLTIELVRIEFTSLKLILQPITPNPDPTGDIDLHWNYIELAVSYQIYRGASEGELELITTISNAKTTTYKDVGVVGLFYYYQVVASNGTHEIVSNIESVAVYKGGTALETKWFIVIIGAIITGILAMYTIIIDEMRRDEIKIQKSKKMSKGAK
ncbi:MAG TPA: hypothetical protein VMV49_09980, partial [Candidatus Deferrimicrobium sp.]|nr:hypothetical protein [Candidatus Deferrimicrobium sp.]